MEFMTNLQSGLDEQKPSLFGRHTTFSYIAAMLSLATKN